MKTMFSRFLKNKSGATAIEYGLIAALVAVAIIPAATLVGGDLDGIFTSVSTSLSTAATAPTPTTTP